ncbi:hypothetical protein L914_09716 [Phytophthora nicotianae]|uniref:Uncharacterized protein n=1 Tax=Phytophthora nicotianae TaxID=4792 RepID=W2NBS5_PHYNI|nr:hypothetical protein L914_09716 [Phytophthora nicotianae]
METTRAHGKRKRDYSDDENDDEGDLLAFLDDQYHHEQKYVAVAADSVNCLGPCGEISLKHPLHSGPKPSLELVQQNSKHESNTTMDNFDALLLQQKIERKREQDRLRQRRFREKTASLQMGNPLYQHDNESECELIPGEQQELRACSPDETITEQSFAFNHELTPTQRVEWLSRLRKALGPDGLDECVCTVCDRLEIRNDTIPVMSENEEANVIERRIGLADTCTPLLAHELPPAPISGERQFEVRRSD